MGTWCEAGVQHHCRLFGNLVRESLFGLFAFVCGSADRNLLARNERPWGTPDYVKRLRKSLDDAGFHGTQIVGSDGGIGGDEVAAMKADPEFSAAVPILGAHYPCAREAPAALWELPGPEKTVWSSEDNSGISGNWRGGGCWGRSLLQNFVKLNMSSTSEMLILSRFACTRVADPKRIRIAVSWSTIWAAYEPWMYLGSGLGPSSWEPWSGNYSLYPSIWTNAHVGQFSEPGWRYLGGEGSGLLPGGGSYTAMVPASDRNALTVGTSSGRRRVREAQASDFSLVIEKLEGACLRCKVGATTSESVSYKLAAVYAGVDSLACWVSNSSTQFVRVADVPVHGGLFTVHVERDTMMTLTTTTGQTRGVAPSSLTARYRPFPLPYATTFATDAVHKPARFFADNEGSFEVLASLTGQGQELSQTTPFYPMLGYGDVDPISSFGAADWSNVGIRATVQIVSPRPNYAVGDKFVVDPDAVTGLLHKPAPTFPPAGWNGFASCSASNCSVSHGAYAGVCNRLLIRYTGVCLLVGAGLSGHEPGSAGYHRGWSVVVATSGNCSSWGWDSVAAGALPGDFALTAFHDLGLTSLGRTVGASLDGQQLFTGSIAPGVQLSAAGLVSIRTGYHYARFKSVEAFAVEGVNQSAWPAVLFDKHLLSPPHAYPGGSSVSPVERSDLTGLVGCAFTLAKDVTAVALGRFASGSKADQIHELQLLLSSSHAVVASARVDLNETAGDVNGFAWSRLPEPVALDAGTRYMIVSSETKNGDTFFDRETMVQASPGLLRGFATPVWKGTDWGPEAPQDNDPGFSSGNCYGPLNAQVHR